MKRHRKPETVKVGSVVVKIYARKVMAKTGKQYPAWEVSDYSQGHRRLRAFGDHREALKEAARIARQISTGECTAASMLSTEAASYGRALELLRPTGASLEIAAATYARAIEVLGGDAVIEACNFYAGHRADRLIPRTVPEAVAELIEQRTGRGKSIRYLQKLRSRLGRFSRVFAVDIGTVTTPDVQRFLDGLKLAPQTVNTFRKVLHTLFSFAEARGYIFKGGNPVVGVEKIEANGDSAIEIFTPAEMVALLVNAPESFVPFLALGAFAGLRSAEIQRLEWSDLDMAGGFIHVAAEKAKTRSRRLVPILPNLAQWLAPYAGSKGNVWKGSESELMIARADTVKASGVAWKANALRHSFCSYRLADVQNAAQVALEAGNSPSMVFAHYRELVKPEAAKAWFAIAPEAPANVIAMGKATM